MTFRSHSKKDAFSSQSVRSPAVLASPSTPVAATAQSTRTLSLPATSQTSQSALSCSPPARLVSAISALPSRVLFAADDMDVDDSDHDANEDGSGNGAQHEAPPNVEVCTSAVLAEVTLLHFFQQANASPLLPTGGVEALILPSLSHS